MCDARRSKVQLEEAEHTKEPKHARSTRFHRGIRIAHRIAVQFLRSVDLMTDMQDCGFDDPRSDCFQRGTNLTPILVGSAIALAGYVYGLIDAGASTRRMNAKHGLDISRLDGKPTLARDGSVRAEFRIPLPASR
jgi:hypothetical protein